MTSVLDTVKEWINPDWVRHRSVPRMETGLRPNLRLDEAELVLAPGALELDDIVVLPDGTVWLSTGTAVARLDGAATAPVADLGGRVSALAADGTRLVAAVEARGLVTVSTDGTVGEVCADPAVRSCVTAIVGAPDGSLLVSVGSTNTDVMGDWGRALLAGDASGRIVRVVDGAATVVADALAWPAGIALSGDDEVILSLSLQHRLEIRSLRALAQAGRPVATNLPVYPGRIVPAADGHWVAAPRPRNRVTELLLDERALLDEMVATIDRQEWFVPLLRAGNLFTEAMQMGQLRVLGVVKSWAPARSGGVVFRLDDSGRIAESAHARVDSDRHGVTGVAVVDGRVTVVLAGHGSVLALSDTDEGGGQSVARQKEN